MFKIKSIIMLLCCIMLSSIFYSKVYLFKSETPETNEIITYELTEDEENDGYVLTLSNDYAQLKAVYDKDMDASKWAIVLTNYSYVGFKKDGKIYVNGVTESGKKINVTKKYGSYPWYPSWEFMFVPFMSGSEKKMVFWSVRSDTGEICKMQMVKDIEDTINVSGIDYDAVRIKITAYGVPEMFYKEYYWVDKDGVFLAMDIMNKKGKKIGTYERYKIE